MPCARPASRRSSVTLTDPLLLPAFPSGSKSGNCRPSLSGSQVTVTAIPHAHVVRRAADDVGQHANPLLEVDQRDAVGLPARERGAGRLGPVLDHGGVDRGPARWRVRHSSDEPGAAQQCGQKARG